MATKACPIAAYLLAVFLGGTQIAYATNASFSATRETRDATTKEDGMSTSTCPGPYSWSIQCDLILDDTGANFDALMTAFIAGSVLNVYLGGGPRNYGGDAILTELSLTAGLGGSNAEASASFQNVGPLSIDTAGSGT